ncbi:F-box protein 21, partial [Lecanoromycetidae sp. Uapishka_2]
MAITLSELPNEVIYQILLSIPPTSVPTLQKVSRQFNDLAQPILWRHHCQTLYRYWSPEHRMRENFNGPVAKIDWKNIFAERHGVDRITSTAIDSILASQVSRIEKTERIIGHNYDAKDTLLRQLNVEDDAEDVLARRFYSDAVLGTLHRTMAIKEWVKLKDGEPVPLERALAAFDMFVLHGRRGDFDEVSAQLDQLAEGVLTEDPEFVDQPPRRQAIAVAEYLREHNMVGISRAATDYHDLQNNFIGIALQDDDHPSLPLITVAIYCCVAKRLGLDAQPCGFPFHVQAIIKPAAGHDLEGHAVEPGKETLPMYMDPFRSSLETDVKDLVAQLHALGVKPSAHAELLSASPVEEIVRRSAKNIITSVQTLPRLDGGRPISSPLSFPETESAFYGALWALILLPDGNRLQAGVQRARYLHFLVERLEKQTLMDVGLMEEQILPLIEDASQYRGLLDTIRVIRTADRKPKEVKDRSSETRKSVQYKVGQIFHHKRYYYTAVITGWDVECAAGADWMTHMNVHALSRGQHQSFYHVLVEDGTVRYVAEENILIVQEEVGAELMAMAGQHFKRWDHTSKIFISNIKDEYPDD